MELFKIMLGNQKAEFSMRGIANISKRTVHFQGLLNGIPFTENEDYEVVRATIMRAVEINTKKELDH